MFKKIIYSKIITFLDYPVIPVKKASYYHSRKN